VTLAEGLGAVTLASGAGAVWCHWRAMKTTQLRPVLERLRALMDTVITEGGLPAHRFLEGTAQQDEYALGDLIPGLNDRKLRRRCQEALQGYKQTWAAAPPRTPPIVVVGGGPPDPTEEAEERLRREQGARQAAHARACRDSIQAALARASTLERFTWRR
jgi:hypothetical protein